MCMTNKLKAWKNDPMAFWHPAFVRPGNSLTKIKLSCFLGEAENGMGGDFCVKSVAYRGFALRDEAYSKELSGGITAVIVRYQIFSA